MTTISTSGVIELNENAFRLMMALDTAVSNLPKISCLYRGYSNVQYLYYVAI